MARATGSTFVFCPARGGRGGFLFWNYGREAYWLLYLIFLPSAGGAQEAFPARPLVNHPPPKRNRRTATWFPFVIPSCRLPAGQSERDRTYILADVLVSKTSAERTFHNGKAESAGDPCGQDRPTLAESEADPTTMENNFSLRPSAPRHCQFHDNENIALQSLHELPLFARVSCVQSCASGGSRQERGS